jgi:hypothetical protein
MTWPLARDSVGPDVAGRARYRSAELTLCAGLFAAACSPAANGTPAPDTSLAATATAPADAAAWAQSQVGAGNVVLIDDWKAANDSGHPQSKLQKNLAVPGNTLRIQPSALARPQQPWSIDLAYGISVSSPDDYVGFDRDLPVPQDWRGTDHVLIDVDARRAPGVALVFQFWEASGEVWRHTAQPSSLANGEPLRIPLDTQSFQRATWSTLANGAIDLGAINSYGIYIGHTGAGRAGVVTLGAITAYKAAAPTR